MEAGRVDTSCRSETTAWQANLCAEFRRVRSELAEIEGRHAVISEGGLRYILVPLRDYGLAGHPLSLVSDVSVSRPLRHYGRLRYVYVLVCDGDNDRHYTGVTQRLTDRVKEHNRGKCLATAAFRPWSIQTTIAFKNEGKARSFERYLKTGSGREFARRHF